MARQERYYWHGQNPNGGGRQRITEEEYKRLNGITGPISDEQYNRISSGQEYERLHGKSDRMNTAVGDDLSALHGQATLQRAANHKLSDLAPAAGAPGLPLGRGLVWDVARLQGHGITFGATRSGKGVTSVIPALLSYSGSMVVIDPKGENAWATAERRRRMGQRVVILDPWEEVHKRYGSKVSPPVLEPTTRFNPLSSIDPDSDDFADDVAALADALVISSGGMESHWTDSARELISGLIAARIEIEPGKAHLGPVRRAIVSSDKELSDLVAGIIAARPDGLAARKLRRFMDMGENKELRSVRSTAETQTAILDSRRLIASMKTGEPAFNLDELATGKVTLYLVLPLDRLQTHGRWLRLILTMAIRAIARQEEAPAQPVMFLLDEMGTIGGLRMVEQAYGLMAGVGIRIWGFLQDVNQLKRDYPESWETFISNASVIQALKVADITTSNYLSELLGTVTLERFSAETLHLQKQNPSLKGMGDQVHGRPLLLPQEIRELPATQALNILPGNGNYLLERMPYFAADSVWKGQYRSPPKFAAANGTQQPKPAAPPPAVVSQFQMSGANPYAMKVSTSITTSPDTPPPPKKRGLFG